MMSAHKQQVTMVRKSVSSGFRREMKAEKKLQFETFYVCRMWWEFTFEEMKGEKEE